MAFSLTEKLAVTGAFLALVALVVGTEDDPGVIASQDTVAAAQQAAAGRNAAVQGEPPKRSSSNYWSVGSDSQPAPGSAPVAPGLLPKRPEEHLPPGFGATPSPDLPK